jgi:YndJ-like protein
MLSIEDRSNHADGRWNSTVSVCGAAVWSAFAALAGLRRSPFGMIELLFLFAVLVIVPLGSELAAVISGDAKASVPRHVLQLIAMLGVSIAFWLPPGRAAGMLSAPWLAVCVAWAAGQLIHAMQRRLVAHSLLVGLAHVDLVLGAAWLVASRTGLRPMGFQEPIILLTAVHFHYSGFATALIAAATWKEFETRRLRVAGLQTLVWLVALLPFVLAAGFVFSPQLRFIAAISLSACVTALALISWWIAGDWRSRPAKTYLRLSTIAAVGAFSLAGAYAFSEYFHKDWITVPGMANSHGLLNGIGFVLLGILGWLMELHGRIAPAKVTTEALKPEAVRKPQQSAILAHTGGSMAFSQADLGRANAPDFLARDFYDR